MSGVVPLPAWPEILIEPQTGLIHEQRMRASSHFMDSRFSGFVGG